MVFHSILCNFAPDCCKKTFIYIYLTFILVTILYLEFWRLNIHDDIDLLQKSTRIKKYLNSSTKIHALYV